MTNSINSLQGNLWKWLTISFGSIILIYGILRITPVMRGVVIQTYLPEAEEMSMDTIMLTGTANHAKMLSINGRPILIDPSGNFNDELILAPGMNKIQIVAKDIRGNSHSKELVLMGTERIIEIKTAQIDSPIINTN